MVKGKTKNGEQLKDVIQDCLTYVDTCTEFWSQEKPICSWEMEHKFMEQKCGKPRHNAPLEPAQFLLKSLDDVDEGKASFWLNLLLCVFLIKNKTRIVHLSS